MNYRAGVFTIILLVVISQNSATADQIYLKSGRKIEGKVFERRESYNPARDYCEDFNNIVVWDNNTYHCVPKDDILRIEKHFKKPEGLALFAKDDKWGTPENGYVTQLIPQSAEYIVGQPMKFGLVLKNVDTSVKFYDHQAITHNTLIIKIRDHNDSYYKVGCFQTLGAGHPIDAGEIVTLFENRNITDEYVIIKPGKYTIQFSGGIYGMGLDSNFPASNVIEFEVRPGTPDERDLIISSLVDVLPDKCWQAITYPETKNSSITAGEQKKILILLVCTQSHLIGDQITAILWKTETPEEVTENGTQTLKNDYLGRNASGYFYIKVPPSALEYWPTMKKDIIQALGTDGTSSKIP